MPGAAANGGVVNFGLTAAKALEDGLIDGFWANGMGAEIAVRRGVGTVVLDVRRGDGPKPCFRLHDVGARHDRQADRRLARGCGGGGASVGQDAGSAQGRSRTRRGSRAEIVPPDAAALIAELVRRDLNYYDASISRDFIAGMNQFCRDVGILDGNPPYEKVVATQFAALWRG